MEEFNAFKALEDESSIVGLSVGLLTRARNGRLGFVVNVGVGIVQLGDRRANTRP
jgi:hypothetical protein